MATQQKGQHIMSCLQRVFTSQGAGQSAPSALVAAFSDQSAACELN